jgi:ribosomal protein L11 methyltransferase
LNNNYICIKFAVSSDLSDILIALVGEMPFDTFEETPTGVNAYIKANDFTQEVENEIIGLKKTLDFTYEKEEIEAQNWNLLWESNFHPIVIDDFCGIRADFHEPVQQVAYEIVLNPNMAFGTGHHETTHMMIQTMRDMDFQEKRVFDFGCGTGILAIMAGKLGATELLGVDNEYPAYESTLENAVKNGVPQIRCIFGTMASVEEGNFDVILANINRNIIVNALDTLHEKLNDGGYILLSGFLKEDEVFMINAIETKGFSYISTKQRENWVCIKARK